MRAREQEAGMFGYKCFWWAFILLYVGLSVGAYMEQRYGLAAFSAIFVVICAYMIASAGTYFLDLQGVSHWTLFGHFRIRWKDVRRIEEGILGTFVLYGDDKWFALAPHWIWSGKEKSAALACLSHRMHELGLVPYGSPYDGLAYDGCARRNGYFRTSADFKFHRNVRARAVESKGSGVSPIDSYKLAITGELPKASDFPMGTQFVIKDLHVPLAWIPGQGWFGWLGGMPSGPFENVELNAGNNWHTDFDEWVGFVEVSLPESWIKSIIESAGIDTHSSPGRELSITLEEISDRIRGHYGWEAGADGVRRKLGYAECILLAAIVATGTPEMIEELTFWIRRSDVDVDAAALLASLRNPAFELARRELPDVLISTTAGQIARPFPDNYGKLKWPIPIDFRKLPTQLPKASDFPVGSFDYQFRIKELDIPLVYVRGQGWFNWIAGEPSGPFENVEFKQGNNDCVGFEEWVALVEECLKERWINRIFDDAGIDRHAVGPNSIPGWKLGLTLQTISKKFKERYHWKDDADGVSRELGPAECILLVAILAAGMPEIIDYLTAELRSRPDVDAAAYLASLRKPAFELARRELPDVLVSTTAGPITLPFPSGNA